MRHRIYLVWTIVLFCNWSNIESNTNVFACYCLSTSADREQLYSPAIFPATAQRTNGCSRMLEYFYDIHNQINQLPWEHVDMHKSSQWILKMKTNVQKKIKRMEIWPGNYRTSCRNIWNFNWTIDILCIFDFSLACECSASFVSQPVNKPVMFGRHSRLCVGYVLGREMDIWCARFVRIWDLHVYWYIRMYPRLLHEYLLLLWPFLEKQQCIAQSFILSSEYLPSRSLSLVMPSACTRLLLFFSWTVRNAHTHHHQMIYFGGWNVLTPLCHVCRCALCTMRFVYRPPKLVIWSVCVHIHTHTHTRTN